MTNTRTEHTPGPWELIHFGGPQIGHKASGDAVCTMWGDENDPADPFHANARLIAAAPDLVEAAERLLHDISDLMANSEGVTGLHKNGDIAPWSDLDEDGHYNPWLGQGIYHLRTAIAKARGAA